MALTLNKQQMRDALRTSTPERLAKFINTYLMMQRTIGESQLPPLYLKSESHITVIQDEKVRRYPYDTNRHGQIVVTINNQEEIFAELNDFLQQMDGPPQDGTQFFVQYLFALQRLTDVRGCCSWGDYLHANAVAAEYLPASRYVFSVKPEGYIMITYKNNKNETDELRANINPKTGNLVYEGAEYNGIYELVMDQTQDPQIRPLYSRELQNLLEQKSVRQASVTQQQRMSARHEEVQSTSQSQKADSYDSKKLQKNQQKVQTQLDKIGKNMPIISLLRWYQKPGLTKSHKHKKLASALEKVFRKSLPVSQGSSPEDVWTDAISTIKGHEVSLDGTFSAVLMAIKSELVGKSIDDPHTIQADINPPPSIEPVVSSS